MTQQPLPADLAALAQAHGVATEYWSWQHEQVVVAEDSIRAVLGALGVPAADDTQVSASLAEVETAGWRRVLPPTVVMREGWTPWVPVHVPHGAAVQLHLELEDGRRWQATQVDHWVDPREVDGQLVGEATFELPGTLPLGWHRLVAEVDGSSGEDTASAVLIVTPRRLELPAALREGRVWGLMAQLYQARSRESWGVGDLADLADLAAWSGRDLGADFVLVNPLHAAEPFAPMEPSPYLPTTRRFVNPLYLRIEDVPEIGYLPPPQLERISALAKAARRLSAAATIDRDGAWRAKREALQLIYQHGLSGRRERSFRAYCAAEGEGLHRFATWCALADHHGLPWTTWPQELRDPASPAVTDFQEMYADEIDFYRWLQWLLDRQLGQAQADALDAGMSLGVVHDLAVGVHPRGADAWGLQHALAQGVTVGAPPDQFTQLGQNWNQPPWHPGRLAELGYAPYRDMLQTVLKDSGGIRVDHIIGLFRLWWIPDGGSPADGTYVRYDPEALIGILCLEAHRAGAVVIGEDLGVVPPEARDYLAERGVLGTSIMWFEWEDGRPMAPEAYRELCMTTVTTHDLPPTAGYLQLEHVAVRDRLGLLTRPVEQVRADEQETLDRILALLVERGLLGQDASVEDQVLALHSFIARTPSRMLGVALPDLVGDRHPVNQPGTSTEYPNWQVPLTDATGRPVMLEELMSSPLAARIAQRLA